MSSPGKTPQQIKLDERNHVEKPLLKLPGQNAAADQAG